MHPDGPVLVVAGAGSGKTRVLTRRIALPLARARRARRTRSSRSRSRTAPRARCASASSASSAAARGMWVLTFHAACGRILRREADRLGYRSNFTIYDQADQVRVVKRLPRGARPRPEALPAARHPLAHLGREEPPRRAPPSSPSRSATSSTSVVADVFELYERRLHAANAMDFDDLLVRTRRPAGALPRRARALAGAFRHLLVDEYQDTNHAQYRIVRLLGGGHRNVFVVGDADQAIYTWRGADIRNILDFERDFPDAPARSASSRTTAPRRRILDAANAVIEHNADRLEKRLWSELGTGEPVRIVEVEDEHAEARLVADAHRRADRGRRLGRGDRGLLPHERAVARARGPARAPRRALPVIGGPRFYERAEIKDAMAYLQALRQPERRDLAAPHHQHAAARHRRHQSLDRIAALRGEPRPAALGGASCTPPTRGSRPRASARCAAFRGAHEGHAATACDELGVGDAVEHAASTPAACSTRSRPSARSRRRGASRTCRSWSASRASTRRARRSRRSTASCRRSRSSPTPTRWPTARRSPSRRSR